MTTAPAENRVVLVNGGIALLLWLVALAVFALTASSSLGCDEPQTANIVQYSSSWTDMFRNIVHDANSPLVYMILRAWTTVFGSADQSFKACVILIASLIPPSIYLGFQEKLDKRIAIQIALATALCASFVHHSQLVRSYGLVILLGLLATFQLQRMLERPQSKTNLGLYALLMVAIPYAHLSGLVVWCGHVAVVAFKSWRGRLDRQARVGFVICIALAAVAVVPLFLPPISTVRQVGIEHVLRRSVWPAVLLLILPRLVLLAGQHANLPLSLAVSAAVFWITYMLVIKARNSMKDRFPRFDLELWLVMLAGMILAETVVATQLLRETYVVHFIVPMLLTIVLGFEIVGTRLPRWLVCVMPFVVLLPLWLPQLAAMHNERRFGAAVVADILHQQAASGKAAPYLVITREWYCTGIARYLDANIPYVCLLSLAPSKIIDYMQVQTMDPQPNIAKLESLMFDTLAQKRTVFHLYARRKTNESGQADTEGGDFERKQEKSSAEIEAWLSAHAKLVGRRELPDCAGPMLLSEYR